MAGQRVEGLQDFYFLRHLEIVRPACEAVYERYFAAKSGAKKNASDNEFNSLKFRATIFAIDICTSPSKFMQIDRFAGSVKEMIELCNRGKFFEVQA